MVTLNRIGMLGLLFIAAGVLAFFGSLLFGGHVQTWMAVSWAFTSLALCGGNVSLHRTIETQERTIEILRDSSQRSSKIIEGWIAGGRG